MAENDSKTHVAVMGRKRTLFRKSTIEKNALEVGCYFCFLATFRYELKSFSRQSLASPDPLRKQAMGWTPTEWLENKQKLIVDQG